VQRNPLWRQWLVRHVRARVACSYGRAINAADGHHVGGVQLIFTAQRGGMSRSIFTSSTGSFSIELPAGDYSVKAQKTGFSESVQSVKVEAGKMVKVPIVLSEIIDTRMARFIMTWGTTPKNLDVYLKTPSGCIVSYQSKKCYAGEDVEAQLDFDETEGYGPETITIKNPQNGKYQYWVQQFSKDGSLLDSKATLLLIADGKISKYQVCHATPLSRQCS
jgi:adhesin/invasin